MANPQDNKRSDQSDKSKSGQQGDQGSRPEPRQGQGGRPGEGQEFPKSSEKKRSGVTEDEESDEQAGK